jgi:hypothetical protein
MERTCNRHEHWCKDHVKETGINILTIVSVNMLQGIFKVDPERVNKVKK